MDKNEKVPANVLKLRNNKKIEMKTEAEKKVLRQTFSNLLKIF